MVFILEADKKHLFLPRLYLFHETKECPLYMKYFSTLKNNGGGGVRREQREHVFMSS